MYKEHELISYNRPFLFLLVSRIKDGLYVQGDFGDWEKTVIKSEQLWPTGGIF